jgi:hypothetical protein
MPSGTVYTGIRGKKTICKCPKCGKLHELFMDWRGRGRIPKKFCYDCKYMVDEYSGSIEDCFGFRARAISGRR